MNYPGSPGINPVTGKPYKYAVKCGNTFHCGSDDRKEADKQFDMFMENRPSQSYSWTLMEDGNMIRMGTNPTGKSAAMSAAKK